MGIMRLQKGHQRRDGARRRETVFELSQRISAMEARMEQHHDDIKTAVSLLRTLTTYMGKSSWEGFDSNRSDELLQEITLKCARIAADPLCTASSLTGTSGAEH